MTGGLGRGPGHVSRRPERPGDEAFRYALFCQTFGDIFAGLDDAMRDLLLRQQFAGQSVGYRASYPAARFDIVETDGVPVGRIITALTPEALVIVDIALLATARNHGIGTLLLQTIFAEAVERPVRLQVLASNGGALRFYLRLGFVETARTEVEITMERRACETAPPSRPRP